MRSHQKIVLLVALLVFVIPSCKMRNGESGISEGVMKYHITYLVDENENPIVSLMPSFINMSFKQSSVLLEVEGWMGVFKSSFIKNREDAQAITLLKMMNKKYCYRSPESQGYMGFSAYNNILIDFDEQTKQILDFNCKHAVVSLTDKQLTFDIYYTEEIRIEKPNEYTPFSGVPGVLMDFQIEINGIPMHLVAYEIKEVEIPDAKFEVPIDYQDVPREELDKIFSSLL